MWTQIYLEEEVEVTWDLPVKKLQDFKYFSLKDWPPGQKPAHTHQVKVVKYFGRFVHLGHSDQDLIVNVLLKGLHVKSYPLLQGVVHLQEQRQLQNMATSSSALLHTSLLPVIHLTILHVRVSRFSVLMMSHICFLISFSFETLSSKLSKEKKNHSKQINVHNPDAMTVYVLTNGITWK